MQNIVDMAAVHAAAMLLSLPMCRQPISVTIRVHHLNSYTAESLRTSRSNRQSSMTFENNRQIDWKKILVFIIEHHHYYLIDWSEESLLICVQSSIANRTAPLNCCAFSDCDIKLISSRRRFRNFFDMVSSMSFLSICLSALVEQVARSARGNISRDALLIADDSFANITLSIYVQIIAQKLVLFIQQIIFLR